MDIKALLKSQEQDVSTLIAKLKTGRPADEPKTSVYKAQLDPLKHDVNDVLKRPDKKVKVDKPEEAAGNVINITSVAETEETTRREPVARIALAIQKLIVKRAVAFTFGNPVALNSEPETDNEKAVLKAVNRVMYDVKGNAVNRKVARSLFSSTEVAERWYTVEADNTNYGFASKHKIKVALFSPLLGDKLYPYFDETGDMVAFSREFERKEDKDKSITYFETYTEEDHRLWANTNNTWELVKGYPKPNILGKIPVIWGRQDQVEWEDVQGLIDRLEKLLSNFADTNDYHASPKIFTTGTILGFAKKGESGAIIEGDEGATAQYLSWQNAPESVKLEIETLLRMIYTITQTPDISFDAVKGIGAVSGVALKLLFLDAHLKVQDKQEIFADYLQRRVNLIKAFIAKCNTGLAKECADLIIEPEIIPYMIDDEKAKVDLLVAANGGKPIASQKLTVQQLGWASDSDTELEQIQAEAEAESAFYQGEPTM